MRYSKRTKRTVHQIAEEQKEKNRCYVCHKKFGKHFTFHHKRYLASDKIYSDFKTTYDYNLYVLPIIDKDPNRFTLLCKGHHTLVEKLKRFKPERLERLFRVVKESK